MNHPDDLHDRDQEQLQALFDATAAEPDRASLDRLARAAARLPEGKPQPWWRWLRLGVPAALAAALVLALWLGQRPGPAPEAPAPIARTAAPLPAETPSTPAEDGEGEEIELAVEYDQLDDEGDPLDDLDDPLAALDMGAAMASPSSLLDLLDPGDDEIALEAAADGFSALLEGG